jgi:transcriptional regulator with XRE-family HTH domain
MGDYMDYRLASVDQIAGSLGERAAAARLSKNMTQKQLAEIAGVGVNTVQRLESGDNPRLDTLIRVLKALGLSGNLEAILPDANVRPVDRVRMKGQERQRARPAAPDQGRAKAFSWGNDKVTK